LYLNAFAVTSVHQLIDHFITHGNVDQAVYATTGWSKSVVTPAFLQLIYGAGSSSADTYGLGWRCDDDMMMNYLD